MLKPTKPLLPEDAAYIAGLLDGEGSIFINHRWGGNSKSSRRRVHALGVNIANTNQPVLEWLLSVVGEGAIQKKKCAGYPGKRKDIWYWHITDAAAERFLLSISAWVRIKKLHIEEALRFREAQRDNGNQNHRGGGRLFVTVVGDCLTMRRLNGRPEGCSFTMEEGG